MKEKKSFDLLKVLAITLLVFALLSWIIPAGSYSSGTYNLYGSKMTVGLYDLIRTPAITIATFIQYGLVFLTIGGFYGVLNKTGVYSKLVDTVTKKWEKNKKTFLIITTVVFALLSSLTSLPTLIFVLVPFFVTVLMKLGYKKMPAFAATVGALLVGQIGTTIGFNIWGYLQYYLKLEVTAMLGARIILFLMITTLFVLLISKDTKEEKKSKKEAKEELEIPLYEENTSKKSLVPFIIVIVAMFAILVLGMYNWYYGYNFEAFGNLHESIMGYEISGFPIFAHLLGSVSELGFWGNYDLVVILILASLLIGWIYSVKLKDVLSGFAEGAKKMLPTAFYAMLASVIFACILSMTVNNTSINFIFTVVDKILSSSDKFSLLGTISSSFITSFAYNDFNTLAGTFAPVFSVVNGDMLPITAVIVQSIYGFVMLIAPTSIFLLAGLKYMEIPYKEWMKYIWKFALIVLAIIVVVGFVLTTLV